MEGFGLWTLGFGLGFGIVGLGFRRLGLLTGATLGIMENKMEATI